MPSISKMIDGYRVFKSTTYPQHKDLIEHIIRLREKPKTLVITSCSLRIAPDTIFGCNPGDLYVIRNVAGLVPSYDSGVVDGTIAAIEYAIQSLQVENIFILGHAHCDGIELLMNEDDNAKRQRQKELEEQGKSKEDDPMRCWLNIAKEARDAVKRELPNATEEEQERSCEQESILVSMKNLIGYPWVDELLNEGKLMLYGCHFNIESGQLNVFNPDTRFFELVE